MLPCSCCLGLRRCHDEPSEAQSLQSDLHGWRTGDYAVYEYSDETLDAYKPPFQGFSKKRKLDTGRQFLNTSSPKFAFFSNGLTLAFLKRLGTVDSTNDAFMMPVINGSTCFNTCFSRYVGSGSASQDLDGGFVMISRSLS